MKKIYTTIITLLMFGTLLAQNSDDVLMPKLGDKAPKFIANSTNGEINFPEDYYGKWKILFSHPAAFTPVCTTELLELASMHDEFKKINTEVIVLSTDGINSHIQWIESMKSINYKDKGNLDIKFPLISDFGLEVSKKYGMIHSKSNSTKDVRAVFIIDPDDKVRSIFVYPNTVGRNIKEIMRTTLALQESDKKQVLIPANWEEGDDVLMRSPNTVQDSDKMKAKNNPSLYSLAWYMWFIKG